MTSLLIVLTGVVALVTSVQLLFMNQHAYESLLKRYPALKVALALTFLALLVVIPWQLGAVARDEISAIPWEVWLAESRRHGYWNGFLSLIINLLFLMWTFLLPGHLYANSVEKGGGVRPFYPYIVNILAGLLLCTPSNPIYKAIESLSS